MIRKYSRLRKGWHKWTFNSITGVLDISPKFIPEKNDLIIAIQNGSYIDYYNASTLVKRIGIKRDVNVFSAIKNLWMMLNPLNEDTLARYVFVKANEFIYTEIFPNLPN
jgi:hypothetical protein